MIRKVTKCQRKGYAWTISRETPQMTTKLTQDNRMEIFKKIFFYSWGERLKNENSYDVEGRTI